MDRTYICIDLKSYYASVECVHRGLDPLKANLLVADPTGGSNRRIQPAPTRLSAWQSPLP